MPYFLKGEDIVAMNAYIIATITPKEQIANSLDMLVKMLQQEVFGMPLYPTLYDQAAILLINLA